MHNFSALQHPFAHLFQNAYQVRSASFPAAFKNLPSQDGTPLEDGKNKLSLPQSYCGLECCFPYCLYYWNLCSAPWTNVWGILVTVFTIDRSTPVWEHLFLNSWNTAEWQSWRKSHQTSVCQEALGNWHVENCFLPVDRAYPKKPAEETPSPFLMAVLQNTDAPWVALSIPSISHRLKIHWDNLRWRLGVRDHIQPRLTQVQFSVLSYSPVWFTKKQQQNHHSLYSTVLATVGGEGMFHWIWNPSQFVFKNGFYPLQTKAFLHRKCIPKKIHLQTQLELLQQPRTATASLLAKPLTWEAQGKFLLKEEITKKWHHSLTSTDSCLKVSSNISYK